jgi:hypothetical protein
MRQTLTTLSMGASLEVWPLEVPFAHSALAVAAQASRDSTAITEARRVASWFALLGVRSLHGELLVCAPTP